MKIYSCSFRIKHPEKGFIHGRYRDGEVHLAGTSGTTDNSSWKGSTFHTEKEQVVYLDLLQDAIKIQGNLFK